VAVVEAAEVGAVALEAVAAGLLLRPVAAE